jgi:nicotinate phosphoribosyltransferase
VTGSERDDPLRSALFTDLYELTMSAAYFAEGMDRRAVFELFFRRMPPTRNFIIAAGLDEVLSYLEHLRFSADDLAYLADQDRFSREFLDFLAELRFTGDVDALPEGTPVFPDEPLIRVEAPVIEAQLVETMVLNQIHFQSIAASKAARVVMAADGRDVVDFGSRRAHGADAALKVARTSYLAGAAGTSNVLAGKIYGVPIFGTMAHSYVQSHDDEAGALRAFAEVHPDTTLLVDTYGTLEGVRTVVELSRDDERPLRVGGIRLDSGDLGELARQSRRLLDEGGLEHVKIFASSGLDEYTIRELVESGAPIDGFGVGTNMAVSDDAPGLDMAYKLVEYAGRPRMKLSTSKVMHPGPKQVFRSVDGGRMVHDVIARADEELAGQPLLEPVMRGGRRLAAGEISLEDARARAREQLGRLPDRLLGIEARELEYPVSFSPALERALEDLSGSLEADRGAATTSAEYERSSR